MTCHRNGKSIVVEMDTQSGETPGLGLTEQKQGWAMLVLGWVTALFNCAIVSDFSRRFLWLGTVS